MLLMMATFILLTNPSQTYDLCSNDNECPYYCGYNRKCQPPILRDHKCSGYTRHPRECDIASWCDPDKNSTCQLLKNIEEKCEYDYSCIDNYCDSETKICQYRQFINDHCQTNQSCHSNYCETETKTCQSTKESSSSLYFPTLIFMIVIFCFISKKNTPRIDVDIQTDDTQHAPEIQLN